MRKRSADTALNDPRLTGSGPEAETVRGSPRGTKREAEDPPDDPRLVWEGPEAELRAEMPTARGQPTSHRPASALVQESLRCATCKKQVHSKNKVHRHRHQERHQVVDDEGEQPGLFDSSDDEDNGSEEQRNMRASAIMEATRAIMEAILEHYSGWRPYCDVTHPDGSVAGSPPGTDDGRWLAA